MLHNWESSRRESAILTPGQGWAAGDPPDKELGLPSVRVRSGPKTGTLGQFIHWLAIHSVTISEYLLCARLWL